MAAMTTSVAVIVDAAAYAQAVEDAVRASAAYYTSGTSVLDDDTYDRLVRGIAAWEAAHPGQVLLESPTGKVAGGAVEGDVPHTIAMLSLDNVFGVAPVSRHPASQRIGFAKMRHHHGSEQRLVVSARHPWYLEFRVPSPASP